MKWIIELTGRDCTVLSLLTWVRRNANTADEICVNVRPVENHLEYIFDKLRVSSRTEAAL